MGNEAQLSVNQLKCAVLGAPRTVELVQQQRQLVQIVGHLSRLFGGFQKLIPVY